MIRSSIGQGELEAMEVVRPIGIEGRGNKERCCKEQYGRWNGEGGRKERRAEKDNGLGPSFGFVNGRTVRIRRQGRERGCHGQSQ